MNEMRLEPPVGVPPPPSSPEPDVLDPPRSGKGSVVLGFVLAWVIVIGGTMLMAASGLTSAILLPEAVTLVLAIVFLIKGWIRSAAGIFIGLASMFALALLLVAACFGLVSNGSFWK